MAKSKVLHDPIEAKHKKTSKFAVAPSKEQATTGRYMVMGDDYGVGHRVNVGKESASALGSGPIPFGCECFPSDQLK